MSRSPKKPTQDEYLKALERMKRSPRDRIATLAELGVTGLGAAAGGMAVFYIGLKTVIIFGTVIVLSSTPLGWVIVGALVMGALTYLIVRLVRSGGKFDALKEMDIQELEARIHEIRKEANRRMRREPKMTGILESLQLMVAKEYISEEKATDLLGALEKGHLKIDKAFEMIERVVEERSALSSVR